MKPSRLFVKFDSKTAKRILACGQIVVAMVITSKAQAASPGLANSPVNFTNSDLNLFETSQLARQTNPDEFYAVLAQVQKMLARSIAVISAQHPNSYKYHFLNQELNTAHAWIASNVKYLSPETVNFLEGRICSLRGELRDLQQVKVELTWATFLSQTL